MAHRRRTLADARWRRRLNTNFDPAGGYPGGGGNGQGYAPPSPPPAAPPPAPPVPPGGYYQGPSPTPQVPSWPQSQQPPAYVPPPGSAGPADMGYPQPGAPYPSPAPAPAGGAPGAGPPPFSGSAGAGGRVYPGAQPQQPPSAQPNLPEGWQSVAGYVQSRGFQPPAHWTDDYAAVDDLMRTYMAAQQPDYYRTLGQAVAPNYNQYRQWLASQRPGQPTTQALPAGGVAPVGGGGGPGVHGQMTPPPAPAADPFGIPEFDQTWMSYVQRDPANPSLVVARPGHDPWYANQVNKYLAWADSGPQQVFRQLPQYVEQQAARVAEERARVMVQQQMQEYQSAQAARSILQQHQQWLYARDPYGQPLRDWNGQPQLSPVGRAYRSEVERLDAAGLRDPEMINRYALSAVAYQLGQRPQAPPVPGGMYAPQSNGAGATTPISRQPAVPGSAPPPPPADDPNPQASLLQAMREGLAHEGYNDDRIRAELTGAYLGGPMPGWQS